MHLVLLFATIYNLIFHYCHTYRQIARPQPYEPTQGLYQYPLESPFQGEHFILYPGKYDITLRRPGNRRHRRRKIIPQPFKTWEEERDLHQATQPTVRIENLSNIRNGSKMESISPSSDMSSMIN